VREELGIGPETLVIGKIAYFYPPARSAGVVPERLQGRGIKGHEVLIRAAPRVLACFPEARFILVGRGWGPRGPQYEQELKDLATHLGLGRSLLFIGERTDIPDLLAAFDIAVQCSLSDNLAGTVEALLMARPLVTSDIGGFVDTVLHEETGLAATVDDPDALADALLRLLRDRTLAQRLGEQGRRHVEARFTLAKSVADHERLLAARGRTSDGYYRLTVTLARTVSLPFRLLPTGFAVYAALRRHGFSLPRFAGRILRRVTGRVLYRTSLDRSGARVG
jgi:glycosyltransferase involved in cell wall biosynthesis